MSFHDLLNLKIHRKTLLRFVVFFTALSLLAYGLYKGGYLSLWVRIDRSYLAWALLFPWLAQILSVVRWRSISKIQSLEGSFVDYLRWYFAGMFANVFLPTSIGGDALKTTLLYKAQSRSAEVDVSLKKWRLWVSGLTVFWDRLIGLVALVTLGLTVGTSLSIAFQFSQKSATWIAFFAALFILALLERLFKIVRRLIYKISQKFPTLTKAIGDAVEQARKKPTAMLWHFMISMVVQALGAFSILCLALGSGFNLGIRESMDLFLFSTLASLLPLTINGVGIRESVFAGYFKWIGLNPMDGVYLGATFTMVHSLVSLSGVIGFLGLGKNKIP